jgi:hypothetical protein
MRVVKIPGAKSFLFPFGRLLEKGSRNCGGGAVSQRARRSHRGKNHDANDCDLIFTRFSHSGVHPFIIQSLLQRLFLLRAGVSCHIENVAGCRLCCMHLF